MITLKLFTVISAFNEDGDVRWEGEREDTYEGEDWKECCDKAAEYWDYDDSIVPLNEEGHISDTEGNVAKILQENSKGDWEEVSTEVYEYYYERLEIEQGGETLSISEDAVKEFRESKKK